MKLTLHSFKSDIPQAEVCRAGVDYQVSEFEVEPDEAFTFFDKLVHPRDIFYLDNSTNYSLEFWKHDGELWVEITGIRFWACSEVSQEEAIAIIETLNRRESFGEHLPTTGREWSAYAAW